MSPEPDSKIVKRACRGDKDAFSELVEMYQDRIFNALYRMSGSREEAEEVAQDAFLKAWQSMRSFKQASRFSTWLYRIAVNTYLTRMRRMENRLRPGRLSLDAGVSGDADAAEVGDMIAAPSVDDPSAVATRSEVRLAVQGAINELPADFRAVVVLRDIEGRDYSEIAEMLDVSASAVRSKLARARLKLAAMLKDLRDLQ